MKKIFKKIHLWLAIPFGLIITVICLTGSILVFEEEILELCCPSRFFAANRGGEPLPIDVLIAAVEKQLPDSVFVSGIQVNPDKNRNYRINISSLGKGAILVDPFTAEIKGRIAPYEKGQFFSFVRRLHRWFLFEMKPGSVSWGRLITGTSTIVFVISIITGIVIWMPKKLKNLSKRLKIKLRYGLKRFCSDLHTAGGIYVAIILLAMSLTGLTWSFEWYRKGFYKVLGAELQQRPGQENQSQQRSRSQQGNRSQQGDSSRKENRSGQGRSNRQENNPQRPQINYVHWVDVVTLLISENPGYRSISVRDGSAAVSSNRRGNTRASDNYVFDPDTGEITNSTLYADTDRAGRLRGWIYSVHVGSWGGMLTRIMSFVASLTGALLPLTGYYMWLGKKRKRKKIM